MATVYMNPAPIHAASRAALMSSGATARAAAQARNPVPRLIPIYGPTLIAQGNGAKLRAAGLGPVYEGGREEGYIITPGLHQGTRKAGDDIVGFVQPAGRVVKGRGANKGTMRTLGTSRFAIKFSGPNVYAPGWYRGIGLKGGAMKARPFMRPAMQVWMEVYPRMLAKHIASITAGESQKLGLSVRLPF